MIEPNDYVLRALSYYCGAFAGFAVISGDLSLFSAGGCAVLIPAFFAAGHFSASVRVTAKKLVLWSLLLLAALLGSAYLGGGAAVFFLKGLHVRPALSSDAAFFSTCAIMICLIAFLLLYQAVKWFAEPSGRRTSAPGRMERGRMLLSAGLPSFLAACCFALGTCGTLFLLSRISTVHYWLEMSCLSVPSIGLVVIFAKSRKRSLLLLSLACAQGVAVAGVLWVFVRYKFVLWQFPFEPFVRPFYVNTVHLLLAYGIIPAAVLLVEAVVHKGGQES